MAITPEGAVKKKGREICKKLGIYQVAFQAGNGNKNGVPDDLLCVNGLFVTIEYKATAKQKPTELQKHNMRTIRKSGGVPLVVNADNLDRLEKILSLIRDGMAVDFWTWRTKNEALISDVAFVE